MAVRSRVAIVSAVFRCHVLWRGRSDRDAPELQANKRRSLPARRVEGFQPRSIRRSSVAPFALIIPAMSKDEILSLLDAEVAGLKLLRAFVACRSLPQSVDLSLRRMSQRMEISATTHAEIRPASKSRCRVRLR